MTKKAIKWMVTVMSYDEALEELKKLKSEITETLSEIYKENKMLHHDIEGLKQMSKEMINGDYKSVALH